MILSRSILVIFIALFSSQCNVSDGLQSRNGESSDGAGEDDDGFETGKESTTVTGASLVTLDYDNAATDCAVRVGEIVRSVCSLQVIQEDSSTKKANAIASGTTTQWYIPTEKGTSVTPEAVDCFDIDEFTNVCIFLPPSKASTYSFGYRVAEESQAKDVLVEREVSGSAPLSNVAYYTTTLGLYKSDLSFNDYKLELPFVDTAYITVLEHNPVDKKVYMSGDFPGFLGSIFTVNMDGTNFETIVSGGSDLSMNIDSTNGKIYFADSVADAPLKRMNLDGTLVETLYTPSMGMHVAPIKYNKLNSKIYFVENGGIGGPIKSVSNTGTGLAAVGGTEVVAFDIDYTNQKIYFMEWTSGELYKVNFDGTGSTLIYDFPGSANSLAYHAASNKIYLNFSTKITAINVDGSLPTDVITGLTSSIGLDFNDTDDKVLYVSASKLISADITGLNAKTLLEKVISNRVAVDPVEHLFFFKDDTNDRIMIYDELNDIVLPQILKNFVNFSSSGIAVDVTNKKLLFGSDQTDTIYRANYDGSGTETLYVASANLGILHIHEGIVYFQEGTALKKMNPDGTGVANVVANMGAGVYSLNDIFIDTNTSKIGYCRTDAKIYRADLATGTNVEFAIDLTGWSVSIVRCAANSSNGQIYYQDNGAGSGNMERIDRNNTNALTAPFTGWFTGLIVLP